MIRAAWFSAKREWRYALARELHPEGKLINVIGLNPSIADENIDDPTVRRCMSFAWNWGFGRLIVTNVFAWRATNPSELLRQPDPIGPENDRHIAEIAAKADLVVCAWGAHATHLDRDAAVRDLLAASGARDVRCFGLNAGGTPKHPLYLPATSEAIPFHLPAPAARRAA